MSGRVDDSLPNAASAKRAERAPPRSKPSPAQHFRWDVCLEYCLRATGLTFDEFLTEYICDGQSRSKIAKRISDGACPDIRTMSRLMKHFPGLESLYHHPLFALLDPRPLPVNSALSILETNASTTLQGGSAFVRAVKSAMADEGVSGLRPDYRSMYSIGLAAEFVFMLSLVLVRLTESARSPIAHLYHFAWMVRGLPTLGSTDYFADHLPRIHMLVSELRDSVFSTFTTLRIDWRIVEAQWRLKGRFVLQPINLWDDTMQQIVELADPVTEMTDLDEFWAIRNDIDLLEPSKSSVENGAASNGLMRS